MTAATLCEEIEAALRRSDNVAQVLAQSDTSMLVESQTWNPDDEPAVYRVSVEQIS